MVVFVDLQNYTSISL